MKPIKENNVLAVVLIFAVVIFLLLEFMYLTPYGIRIGYYLSGGDANTEAIDVNTDELLREYNEQAETYARYKNEQNMTAQKWAETAKQKANQLAEEYNTIMNNDILKEIY